jgi:hypothetical protein
MVPPLEHPFIHEAKFKEIEQPEFLMSDERHEELKATMRRALAPDASASQPLSRTRAERPRADPQSEPSNDPHTGHHAEPADRWGEE